MCVSNMQYTVHLHRAHKMCVSNMQYTVHLHFKYSIMTKMKEFVVITVGM